MAAGSRLLVSVHNNVHHLYDALRPHLPPGAAYTGHKGSSFYSRTCFSPDGMHFMSGSSDSNAYIWEVRDPGQVVGRGVVVWRSLRRSRPPHTNNSSALSGRGP